MKKDKDDLQTTTQITKDRRWIHVFRKDSSSCATSGTRRVILVTKPVISHEWDKKREVLTTSGTSMLKFVNIDELIVSSNSLICHVF